VWDERQTVVAKMTPIKRIRDNKLTLTLDPFAFILNSFAMGDMIAAAPVIKYLIDNYYVTPESHLVVMKQAFRPLFPFLTDRNIRDFDDKYLPFWGIPPNMPSGLLNKKTDAVFVRNTPKAMHLSHYASITFADTIIPIDQLPYVPLEPVDVSKFGVDFSSSVIIVTTYRDATRMWYADDILKLAEWLKTKGILPVFVGKTDVREELRPNLIPKSSLPDNVTQYGVDLRNKTTIPELASIMRQSLAVCGVDSGPIHLAGTTDVPIIVGYPTVLPEFRIPTRKVGITRPIVPNIECSGCESRWRTTYWNFEKCYFGHANCCREFTARSYIEHLEDILKV
jgi:hypothetical protein